MNETDFKKIVCYDWKLQNSYWEKLMMKIIFIGTAVIKDTTQYTKKVHVDFTNANDAPANASRPLLPYSSFTSLSGLFKLTRGFDCISMSFSVIEKIVKGH